MSEAIKQVSDTTFEQDVLQSETPVLVDLKPSGRFVATDFHRAGGVPGLDSEDGLLGMEMPREIGIAPQDISARAVNQEQRPPIALWLNRHQSGSLQGQALAQ